jgi:acyl transferase domain-containing protein
MAGWLSAEGRCASFREHGDGFVRSEGCGVVVLKRLADARRDGDRIWALIRGSTVAHNGLSNGISVPSGLAQRELIGRALERAGVAPCEIDYLEAHGTGSSRGDSNEALAFMEALAPGRTAERPCAIGCCKPNLGHLEAASGVAGLIKILLCLQHEKLPPIKHLDELNRWIPRGKPFTFLTAEQAWPARPGRPRLAALSNFGFGGANAFFIIEEAPVSEAGPVPAPSDGPKFVCFRARTATSLCAMVERFRAAASPPTDDMLYNANAHRSDFRERLAFCADDVTALQACLAGRPGGAVYASGDFAAELYGSRAALVFGADVLGTEWAAPLDPLRSWSLTARVLAGWEAQRPQGRLPDRYASGEAAARFLSCFWASLVRTAGVAPGTVVVAPGLEGAAYVADGVAAPVELEPWIISGAAADLPVLAGPRRARLENVLPLPAAPEIVPRTGERVRIFVHFGTGGIRVPEACVALQAGDAVRWRQGVIGILLGLFSLGTDIAWGRIASGKKGPLPTYPFDKRYAWFEPSVEVVEKPRPVTA